MSIYKYYLNEVSQNDIPVFLYPYLFSKSLLRLKDIGYFCGMDYASKDIYDFGEYISRYDHSLSTALITWRYTKNKTATLAALFHDVATPCFSHVIDYMNNDYILQESTENYIEQILKNDTDLIKQLKLDEIDIKDIINFKNFSIVDNKRPKLCADRIDGIILSGAIWGKALTSSEISNIVNSICVYTNSDGEKELGFTNEEVANLVIKTNDLIDYLCHTEEDIYMMELLANITKTAIDEGIITYKDLFRLSEETLILRLSNNNNEQINKNMDFFLHGYKDNIPSIELPKIKKRTINPLVNGIRYKNISN